MNHTLSFLLYHFIADPGLSATRRRDFMQLCDFKVRVSSLSIAYSQLHVVPLCPYFILETDVMYSYFMLVLELLLLITLDLWGYEFYYSDICLVIIFTRIYSKVSYIVLFFTFFLIIYYLLELGVPTKIRSGYVP